MKTKIAKAIIKAFKLIGALSAGMITRYAICYNELHLIAIASTLLAILLILAKRLEQTFNTEEEQTK